MICAQIPGQIWCSGAALSRLSRGSGKLQRLAMPATTALGTSHLARGEKPENLSAVDALVGRYEDLKMGTQEIDPYFVWQEETRPKIPHDMYDIEIPSIDLTPAVKLAKLRAEIAASPEKKGSLEEEIATCEAGTAAAGQEIRAACEDYGFFRIVNHGFPKNLLDQLVNICRDMFDFPLEVKHKLTETVPGRPPRGGYNAMKRDTSFAKTAKGNIWNEGFEYEFPDAVQADTIDNFSKILWPEESDKSGNGLAFRSTAGEFGKESSKLTDMLLELMASSLGLPQDSMHSLIKCDPDQIGIRVRVNHFPVCAQPELTWGIHGHTDPSLITWVHQDSVGGLQFCFKDGTWHGVRPIPDSLVINVGDYMQAWTNGRFISAEHRVVANEKGRRFSIANFVLGNIEDITPRPELVDAEHPLVYKSFTRREYMGMLMQKGLSKDRHQMLDYFRVEQSI